MNQHSKREVFPETQNSSAVSEKSRLPLIIISCMLLVSVLSSVFFAAGYYKIRRDTSPKNALYSRAYFHFNSLTVDSFKKKVASGEDMVVLISRPNCPSCIRLEDPFIEYAREKGIADQIYLLNVVLLRKDDDEWSLFKQEYGNLRGTPSYARYSGGELVSKVMWPEEGELTIEDIDQWIAEQNDYFESD